jgi:hypothetical protein
MDTDLKSLDFILIDEKVKKIYFKKGNWNLQKPYIFPKGYTVICKKNTTINLIYSGMIISYSPVQFIGTQKEPITLSGGDAGSHGIILINTGEKSTFHYVTFKNLSNPREKGLDITGAVTFYQAPVEIRNCIFSSNRSEDALNIISSDFSLDHAHFSKTYSDAVDVDFGTGTITNSSFTDCGNDAIDISGSEIEIQNITINGAGDKGLSVGEKSKMKATDIEIKNAQIAVASKDLSELIISSTKISQCRTGLAVYEKKSEFGPAVLKASQISIENADSSYRVQKGSQLIIDDKIISISDEQP